MGNPLELVREDYISDDTPIRLDAVTHEGELPIRLQQLCFSLGKVFPFSEENLTEFLIDFKVSQNDILSVAKFDPEKYMRIRLYDGKDYEVLMLCWLPGQATRIHDHAGSLCAVKVLQGVGSETIYLPHGSERTVRQLKRTSIANGSVTVSRDADIHSLGVSNNAAESLVTLHIYSPPLMTTLPYRVE